MADWDSIECGFNASNETINFGTRVLAGIDNLYETSTLATLKNGNESNTTPNINALIQNGFVIFAINKTLRIFENLECNELLFNVILDDEIVRFCSNVHYLLVGLRNGWVYIFDLRNDFEVVCRRCVCEEIEREGVFVGAFIEEIDALSFVLVTNAGFVYRLTLSNDTEGKLNDESCGLVVHVPTNIHTLTLTHTLLHLCGDRIYSYILKSSQEVVCEEDYLFKQIFSFGKGKILGLQFDGCLVIMCTRTYQLYIINTNTLFEKILLLTDSGAYRILGVTMPDSENNVYLQLIDFAEMSVIFSIKLEQEICIITPEHIHDEILYISILKRDDIVNELRIQAVTETNPENRLKRLLKRQKFDEAEQCAKLFGLSLDYLQKAKAQHIADKLVCEKEDVDRLFTIMDDINDNKFKIETCLTAHSCCSSLRDVERVLKYAQVCLQDDFESAVESQYLYDNIRQLLFRFYTFMELSTLREQDENIDGWNSFSTADLIDELCTALTCHRIEEAIVICHHFDTTTIHQIDIEVVNQILSLLNNVPIDRVLAFLCVFMPLTLLYVPSLPVFVRWSLEKVAHIQTKEPKNFPDTAIDFILTLMQTLKVKGMQQKELHITYEKALDDLSKHLRALEALKVLKYKYGISLLFQDFIEGPKVLAQILLSSMAVQVVEDEAFFKEVVNSNAFNDKDKLDETYSELVKDITQHEEEFWIKVVPVVLKFVGDLNIKLELVLHVLRIAKVPWSKTIREIAEGSLQYSHPLVEQIAKEIEYEPKCIVLQKGPYKLNREFFDSPLYVNTAVNRIIYINLPTMVDDIYQICQDSTERHEANMALIKHFIRKGEYSTALHILDNNNDDEIVSCCNKLLLLATGAINNEHRLLLKNVDYYHIIEHIVQRLIDRSDSDFQSAFKDTLDILQAVYRIHSTFNVKITTDDLRKECSKNRVLDDVINGVCLELRDVSKCVQKLKRAASYFNIPIHTIIIKFCEKVGDLDVIVKACMEMYELDCDSKALCLGVGLILRRMGNVSKGCLDTKVLVDGINLVRKMIVKAILISGKSDIRDCIEMANWIQATYCATRQTLVWSSAALRVEYGMDFVAVPSIGPFSALTNTLEVYTKLIGAHTHTRNVGFLQYLNYDIGLVEVQMLNELEHVFERLKCLGTEGQGLVAFKLVVLFTRGLKNQPDSNIPKDMLDKMVTHCVRQVQQRNFMLECIDQNLAYNLLLCDPVNAKTFIIDSLRLYKRDLQKYQAIAQIYLHFLKMQDCLAGQQLCYTIINMVKWWKKLEKCPLSYDKFFSKDPNVLLKKLLKLNLLDLTSLEQYCDDFGIDVQESYKHYLKYVLINWKVEIEVQKSQVTVEKNTEDNLSEACAPIIDAIANTDTVLEIITYVKNLVSFYQYEVFMFIYKTEASLQPNSNHDKAIMLLWFLKSYVRVCKPGQNEIEEWMTCNPDSNSIDVLSEWRLPFTKTLFGTNVWNIIRPEVTLKTYMKWFNVTLLLKNLSKDDICSYVIKDVVASGVLQSTIPGRWNMQPQHEYLIEQVDKCVEHMHSLERATSAIYLLATNTAGGADQVNAITLCYKYAQQYKHQYSDSSDVRRAVRKVQNKYYSISVTHILQKHRLAVKSYLDIASLPPDELIDVLYTDGSICKKSSLATLNTPDINGAVDEIAELYHFDVWAKRRNLVTNWLLNVNDGSGDSNIDEENLHRSFYVCMSGNVSKWRVWLLKLADEEACIRCLAFKARALKCFYNVSDVEAVETLTNTSNEDFGNYIKKLTIVGNLQNFGFSMTVDTLDMANKRDLLENLEFRLGTAIGAKTMMFICIMYNITEVKYWNNVITAMMKLNMIEELKRSIYFLKTYPQYYTETFYIAAWQKVIDKSFDFSSTLEEQDITNLCISNFNVIQLCPVLPSINLDDIAKKCIQIQRYEFVVLILRYLPVDVQRLYAQETLVKQEGIYEKVKGLFRYGFWNASKECLFLQDLV